MVRRPLSEILPSFAATARYYGSPGLADSSFAFGDHASASVLTEGLFDLQTKLDSDDLREMSEVSVTFREDMLKALLGDPARRAELTFWMLLCALEPMTRGAARRQVDVTRRWLMLSTIDDYLEGEAPTLDPARFTVLDRFPADSFYHRTGFLGQLEWASAAYWYCRSTGDLDEIAASQLGRILPIALTAVEIPDRDIERHSVEAVLQVAQWALRHEPGVSETASRALARVARDATRRRSVRGKAAMGLAMGLAEAAGLDRADTARFVLSEFADLPQGHERFVLLTATADGDADILATILDDLVAAAREHSDHIHRTASPIGAMHAHARMFGLGAKAIVPLVSAGRLEEARQILQAWLGLPEVRPDLAWILINAEFGAVWAFMDRVVTVSSEIGTFDALVDAMNPALGLRISNATGGTGLSPDLQLDGRPSPADAASFEAAIQARLRIEQGCEVLSAADQCGGALVVASWMPVPIAALSLRACGTALPLASSLRVPCTDRRRARAALWTAGVPSGKIETDAVASILGAGSIDCQVFDSDLSVDRFRQVYEDETYDLIWVAAHGVSGGIWPEDAALALDRAHTVSFSELIDFSVPDTERRLLFLNACSMGESAIFGGLAGFGIAAGLAGPSQAVIGHLWPVDDLAAAAFGLLLAAELAAGQRLFEAFASALHARAEAGPDLAAALGNLGLPAAPLREKVASSHDDFGNFLRWASPAFFE
jgi:hypothetical protein